MQEREALARLTALHAVKEQAIDRRFVLCPYCQLLRGAVVHGSSGLACQCPDCGTVTLQQGDLRAWLSDADWIIRKLRGALDVPAQQNAVAITSAIWRLGSCQRRPVILARSLDNILQQPASMARASTRSADPPWVITPAPLSNVDHDPFDGRMEWLPLEERFALYGGNLQFIEPGMTNETGDEEWMHAEHGPFSADFSCVVMPDWPRGPIALSAAQSAVFKALWHFAGRPQEAHVIMVRAGLSSEKPIDVFKVKPKNKGDPKYEGPHYAYKTLVVSNQRAGTYAMPCAGGSMHTANLK